MPPLETAELRQTLACLLVLVGSLLLGCSGEDPAADTADAASDSSTQAEVSAPSAGGPAQSLRAVSLYFPGQTGLLYAEERELPEQDPRDLVASTSADERLRQRVRQILELLIGGPENRALGAPFPAETQILGVDFDRASGTVFVDLGREDNEDPPTGGSKRELLAVYSVVHSIVLNLEEVSRVGLLWNSQQRESFAGHVDLSRPLGANMRFVARQSTD